MEYYSVVYCYNDYNPDNHCNDYLYKQEYIEEPEYVDDQESEIPLWPIALYAGFWTLSVGTFAYQYFKIHNKYHIIFSFLDLI